MKRLAWTLLLLLPLVLIAGAWLGLGWLKGSEGGAQWLLSRAETATGGRLTVARARGNLRDGLVLDGLEWRSDGARVNVGQLRLQADATLFPRRVEVQALDAQTVTIESGLVESTGASNIESTLNALVLPLDMTLVIRDARIGQLAWSHAGADTVADARVQLSGSWSDRIELTQARLETGRFNGSVTGWIDLVGALDTDLEVNGDVLSRDTGDVRVEALALHLAGDRAGLLVEAASAVPAVSAGGTIDDPYGDWRVALQARLPAGLRVPGERVELQDIVSQVEGRHDDWAAAVTARLVSPWASGEIATELAGNLDSATLDAFTFDGPAAQLSGHGQLDWRDEPVFHAQVEAARLDPGVLVDGWPDDQHLRGEVTLDYREDRLLARDGELRDSAGGVLAFSLDHGIDDGRSRLEAHWRGLGWPLDPEAPSRVTSTGTATASGAVDDWEAVADFGVVTAAYPEGQLRIVARGDREGARLQSFSGDALGGRVSGEAMLRWLPARHVTANWAIQHIDLGAVFDALPMVLTARGDLDWDVAAGQARIRVPELGGMVEGQPFTGRLQAALGPQGWSLPDFDLVAERLRYQDIVVHNLSIRPAGGAQGTVQIQAGPLESGDQVLDFADVRLAWDRYPYRLEGTLTRDRLRLDAGAEMAPVAGRSGHWQGQLQSLSLARDDEPLFRLRSPAVLDYGNSRFSSRKLCLDFALSGGLCADRFQAGPEMLAFDLAFEQVPLALVQWAWDYDLEFNQVIDGELSWQRGSGLPTGQARLDISAGRVVDPGRGESIDTGEGRASFTLDAGTLRSGVISLPLPGTGAVDAEFEVDGLALDGTGRVQGRLRANIDDVTVIESLVPGIDGLEGRLAVDLGVQGVVADPRVDGYVRIEQGRFDFPALGLKVRELSLDGEVSRADRLLLKGGFLAGDGRGVLDARVDFEQMDDLSGQLHIGGERLQLVNLPDLEVRANPDMSVAWRQNRWHVAGELMIPEARVSPASEFKARTGESADVRVIAGSKPGETTAMPAQPLSLEGELTVRLGDEVRFDSDIASGRLLGQVGLTWAGHAMPTASGVIDVQGDVRAYGPVLRLDDAHVRFPDVALSNPVLDIRAEREIYGNTQVRSAGVFISGTARRPEVEAYTRPFTTEERAWTLLITGSDIDYSQGIGAFDIGTYIAPRLYLSYGISLFDSENVVGIRYDLRKGFGIKATTGEHESGIDASYTFDH